ncbi:uncharacterized protein [Chelonus insularis]|uniref:uncharacterized protein n=1 Tax=Chelonus insularis TaxID=460826 RepID=UPI00158EB247|nr:uncharacterized protein LOC118064958 [Chelonus insularis]XP_034935819.1 uncharacterized protein LOC118064958 [Chelonus insularis]
MADPECVEMEDEDFEVVDECEGEDEDIIPEKDNENDVVDVNDQNKSPENLENVLTTNKEQNTLSEKIQTNDESNAVFTEKDDVEVVEVIKSSSNKSFETNQSNNENKDVDIIPLEIQGSQKITTNDIPDKNTNTIDFTADISLDQLNDTDVIRNVNDIENINLDSENCRLDIDNPETNKISSNVCSQDNVELTDNTTNESITSSDIIIVDDPQRKKHDDETPVAIPAWYEEKLNEKIATAKERLTKLSRVLKRSYGCYQECLDRVEAAVGTPVCKLFPPRRCPLNEPYINRWRFVCTKKPLEEPAIAKMEEDNIDMTIDKKVETVWQLEPSEGLTRNANNDYQKIPTFVMHVVKIFEDYINSNNQQQDSIPSCKKEDNESCKPSDYTKDVVETIEKKLEDEKQSNEIIEQEQWLWLLVRSNSKNELMLFATGKCISDSTMESMKHFFEKGKGADCNVKSLYCKSLTKVGEVSTSNTTFLLGTEALDETIGGLKIQLAPKTNFWLSTVGAEQLAKEVEIMIVPNPNTVVLDIGCGLGLIGLIMAPKCEKVIGIDSPSEVEEAEMTCELNKINNASFVMGDPKEMIATLSNSLVTKKTSAIINANAEVGRNIDIITGLRKIPSLRRVVMITTLTKQSVHSILKLIQPADDILGDPFVPIRAIVVDTLPIGPQFEVVIRMDRRPMHRIFNMHLSKPLSKLKNQNSQNSKVGSPGKPIDKTLSPSKKFNNGKSNKREANKNLLSPKLDLLKGKGGRPSRLRRQGKKLVKNPFYDTLPKSWEKNKPNVKMGNKKKSPKIETPSYNNDRKDKKFLPSFEQKDVPKRKRDWEGRNFGSSNLNVKKTRNDDNDLRFRLSYNRINSPDLIQQMEKQQKLLEVAKQKLSGSRTSVDSSTAKQLQNMLKIAIENTNQVQSHLRRSVWDRIAPHDKDFPHQEFDSPSIFKGRHVKELDKNDIIITTSNDEFVPNKQQFRSNNSGPPPVEPNLVAPKEKWVVLPPKHDNSYNQSERNQISQDELRNHEESNKTRWAPTACPRRPSPPRHYDELSTSRRSMTSPPPWSSSTPKDKSQHFQQVNRSYDMSLINQRQFSPPRRTLSPQRQRSPLRHRASTPVRHLSPLRRQSSPVRMADDWDIPTRGAVEQHPNWQRGVGRPQNIRQDPPPLMQLRTTIDNTWSANKNNDHWKPSGSNDSWKNQQILDKRYGNQSNDSWNNRNMDVMNSARSNSWMDNKQRWDPPYNLNIWNKGGEREKEDWHDLPEDARDPWGDDGGIGNLGINDRWKQLDNPQPSSSNNWAEKNMPDWPGHNDEWQKKPQMMNMMNNKPLWQGNIESNKNNNSRWNLPNNAPPQQLLGNWQQGNAWRDNSSQNISPFQRLRYFNSNLK